MAVIDKQKSTKQPQIWQPSSRSRRKSPLLRLPLIQIKSKLLVVQTQIMQFEKSSRGDGRARDQQIRQAKCHHFLLRGKCPPKRTTIKVNQSLGKFQAKFTKNKLWYNCPLSYLFCQGSGAKNAIDIYIPQGLFFQKKGGELQLKLQSIEIGVVKKLYLQIGQYRNQFVTSQYPLTKYFQESI